MFTLQTQQVLKKGRQGSVSQQKMVESRCSYLVENEAGHRALSKTLAVDLLVTVRNPAVSVSVLTPLSLHPAAFWVFSRFDCGAVELETLYGWS